MYNLKETAIKIYEKLHEVELKDR